MACGERQRQCVAQRSVYSAGAALRRAIFHLRRLLSPVRIVVSCLSYGGERHSAVLRRMLVKRWHSTARVRSGREAEMAPPRARVMDSGAERPDVNLLLFRAEVRMRE